MRPKNICRGIGLYFASQIIKANDGRLWAESEGRRKGSTFYIECRLKKIMNSE